MQAGASARERLKAAAAQHGASNAPVEAELGRLRRGPFRHVRRIRGRGRKVTLAESRRSKRRISGGCWAAETTTGYSGEIEWQRRFTRSTSRVPGMVYAAVKACPVPWGGLKSFNFEAVKERPGVLAAIELKAVPGKTDFRDAECRRDCCRHLVSRQDRARPDAHRMGLWTLPGSALTRWAEAKRLLDQPGEVSHKAGDDTLG